MLPEDNIGSAQSHRDALAADFERVTQRKLQKARLITWIGHGVYALLMVWGILQTILSNNTKPMLLGGMLFACGLAGLVVIKLWYWVVHARLLLLQEFKQLQLQIAEQQHNTKGP